MKISELILELQDILRDYGNVDCLVENKLNCDYEEPKICFRSFFKRIESTENKIQKACIITSYKLKTIKTKKQLELDFT